MAGAAWTQRVTIHRSSWLEQSFVSIVHALGSLVRHFPSGMYAIKKADSLIDRVVAWGVNYTSSVQRFRVLRRDGGCEACVGSLLWEFEAGEAKLNPKPIRTKSVVGLVKWASRHRLSWVICVFVRLLVIRLECNNSIILSSVYRSTRWSYIDRLC